MEHWRIGWLDAFININDSWWLRDCSESNWLTKKVHCFDLSNNNWKAVGYDTCAD